jgi:hypothetical protein
VIKLLPKLIRPRRCILRLEPDGFSRWLAWQTWWRGKPRQKLIFQIRWDQIDRIIAYKQDMHIYDLVCLGFSIAGELKRHLLVDEEMVGWHELTCRMDDVLHTGHEWYLKIQEPAFERCKTTLWERQRAQSYSSPGVPGEGTRCDDLWTAPASPIEIPPMQKPTEQAPWVFVARHCDLFVATRLRS